MPAEAISGRLDPRQRLESLSGQCGDGSLPHAPLTKRRLNQEVRRSRSSEIDCAGSDSSKYSGAAIQGEALVSNASALLGTWRMVSWTRTAAASGVTADAMGPDPNGYIAYHADGRMMAWSSGAKGENHDPGPRPPSKRRRCSIRCWPMRRAMSSRTARSSIMSMRLGDRMGSGPDPPVQARGRQACHQRRARHGSGQRRRGRLRHGISPGQRNRNNGRSPCLRWFPPLGVGRRGRRVLQSFSTTARRLTWPF